MGLAVWKRQPEQQSVHSEHFFECLGYWNAASFANESDRFIECSRQSPLCRFAKNGIRFHDIWPARMLIDDFHLNRIRTLSFQKVRNNCSHLCRILIWHQPE